MSSSENNESNANLPGPDPIAPLPGTNSATRRRKALRDFYKLQQENASASTEPLPEDVDDSMADFMQDDESQSPLDKPGVAVDDYIRNLIKDGDLKTIVKTENKLVSEIRALDSEQKALVYNNYNKLIAAANTLESMHKNEELSQVHELKDSLNKVSLFVKQSMTPLPEIPDTASSAKLTTETDRVQAARWLLGSSKYLDSLVNANKKQEAQKLANETIKLVDQWPKGPQSLQDQLATIRSKCQDIIDTP